MQTYLTVLEDDMEITTADADTLAELLSNTLQEGWVLTVETAEGMHDVQYRHRDGNAIRVIAAVISEALRFENDKEV